MDNAYNLAKTSETPFVVKNKISSWPLLQYKEHDWTALLKKKSITFRKGNKQFSVKPQWERTCDYEKLDITNFFKLSHDNASEFHYFDYKPVKEVFDEEDNILKTFNWTDLGIPPELSEDSTIWIGNSGAHTPCHMDTYGVNFVAQLYGRKFWLLIPPEETAQMKPTRVPYEESSVYSQMNFFTPTRNITDLKKMYSVILEPGDVLFVPRHWWHYVENLEIAISINTWIPSEKDKESRIEEFLVQRFVWSICQDLTLEDVQKILNPNEDTLMNSSPKDDILEKLVEECFKSNKPKSQKTDEPLEKKAKSEKVPYLNPLSADDVRNYVQEKGARYKYDPEVISGQNVDFKNCLSVAEVLINSMCHPDTIRVAKDKILDQFGEKKLRTCVRS